jgi:hypothetical protein
MDYIKVKWLHTNPDEPILLYSELDGDRWEVRKVEVFADGKIGIASATEATSSTRTMLGIAPVPPLDEIATDPEFQPVKITKDEFEEAWSAGRSRI